MMNLSKLKMNDLRELAKYYGISSFGITKKKLVKKLEALIENENVEQQEMELEEVPMSVRVRRIKEQNSG